LGLTARLEHFDVGQLFGVFVPTVGHGATRGSEAICAKVLDIKAENSTILWCQYVTLVH
jgi:hypothetical protein